MVTAEDNFRVEVWKSDGTTLLETVSRSPDFQVSIAAWHAAIRRRPGLTLVHLNADRVMERVKAPGEPVADPAAIYNDSLYDRLDPTLSDLRKWHRLRAWCIGCSHHAWLKTNRLIAKHGKEASLSTVEGRYSCSKCTIGSVRIEVHNAPRD